MLWRAAAKHPAARACCVLVGAQVIYIKRGSLTIATLSFMLYTRKAELCTCCHALVQQPEQIYEQTLQHPDEPVKLAQAKSAGTQYADLCKYSQHVFAMLLEHTGFWGDVYALHSCSLPPSHAGAAPQALLLAGVPCSRCRASHEAHGRACMIGLRRCCRRRLPGVRVLYLYRRTAALPDRAVPRRAAARHCQRGI